MASLPTSAAQFDTFRSYGAPANPSSLPSQPHAVRRLGAHGEVHRGEGRQEAEGGQEAGGEGGAEAEEAEARKKIIVCVSWF